MNQQQAGEKAASYFGAGYHCAEAVVAAFLETIGEDDPNAIAHATAFGGGFGKTFAEACGVLSGGMIAIGHMCGRRQRGEDWDIELLGYSAKPTWDVTPKAFNVNSPGCNPG